MPRTALAGLAALALAVSAVGPCHCLLDTAACHREAQEPDAHACCEKPIGVQAVADECCDSTPDLVVASTDVPEVAPPALRSGTVHPALPGVHSISAITVRPLPPPALERTTVLLI